MTRNGMRQGGMRQRGMRQGGMRQGGVMHGGMQQGRMRFPWHDQLSARKDSRFRECEDAFGCSFDRFAVRPVGGFGSDDSALT